MKRELADSVSGSTELVFPDDSTGKTYSLRDLKVWEAGDVSEELGGDIPEYGDWLPVILEETGEEAFLIAPGHLRKTLVNEEIEAGERFVIGSMEKQGRDQSSPYRVTVSYPDREETPESQTSLKATGSGD